MLGIISIEDAGGDVLLVKATDGQRAYEATGWVSATKNHSGADAYGEDGYLKDGSVSRAMTPEEVRTYALDLINAAWFPAPPAAPDPIVFAPAQEDQELAAALLAAQTAAAAEPDGSGG